MSVEKVLDFQGFQQFEQGFLQVGGRTVLISDDIFPIRRGCCVVNEKSEKAFRFRCPGVGGKAGASVAGKAGVAAFVRVIVFPFFGERHIDSGKYICVGTNRADFFHIAVKNRKIGRICIKDSRRNRWEP